MNANRPSTLIRTKSNFAEDQDVKFARRYSLSDAMRAGCCAATRSPMVRGHGVFDLDLGSPVTVVLNDYILGHVQNAIGLIVYQDQYIDALFFVFRSKKGDLVAVMGGGKNVSNAIEGWLEFNRYIEQSWDPLARKCSEVFAVDDFPFLWTDGDGVIAGADVEGSVVSVNKAHLYASYERVPEANLLRIHSGSTALWVNQGEYGALNAH